MLFQIKLKPLQLNLVLNLLLNLLLINIFCFINSTAYGAAGQILNSIFFPNPAELSQTQQSKITGGTILIQPKLTFKGNYAGQDGQATSEVQNILPYALLDYRWNDKLVTRLNFTPSTYGHIEWPVDSIVSQGGTTTELIFYRFGLQVGYQFDDALSLGAGLNIEYNRNADLNFTIPNLGHQINNASDYNLVPDIGLFYKINNKNFITAAVYTGVDTFSDFGSSFIGNQRVDNYQFLILDAPVAYIGAQQLLSSQWFLEEKIYWSGWSIVNNVEFKNTVTGNYNFPVHWGDAFSYQIFSHYALQEKLGLLGSITYETNPVPQSTNQIGYPVSSTLGLLAGFDYALDQHWQIQLLYSYATFTPDAIIDNNSGNGKVSAQFQMGSVQLSYKI